MSSKTRRTTPQVVDVLADPQPTGTDPVPAPALEPAREPAPARRLHSVPAATPHTPPVPESELTPEQRRIRDLENQLALERGRKDPEQEFEVASEPADGDNIIIHFVADGFTALGHVWRRGQELEFTVGGGAYLDTCNRFGWSWLELRDNPAAQEDKWGEVKFRSGPWTGLTYADAAKKARFERLGPLREGQLAPTAPDENELARADEAERRRRRAAPRLPLH
jgi:hypothetical protein